MSRWRFNRFRNDLFCKERFNYLLCNSLYICASWVRKQGSSRPGVVYTLHKWQFLSDTRMRFRLMLSSMSAAADAAVKKWSFWISWKTAATTSNCDICCKVALDSVYIMTGNDVNIYFRSAANRVNATVFTVLGSAFFGNSSNDFEKVYTFGKGGSSASFLFANIKHFCPLTPKIMTM